MEYLGKEKIIKAYELDENKAKKADENDIIEMIAQKKNLLKKGGEPDYKKGARELLEKYQKHEI